MQPELSFSPDDWPDEGLEATIREDYGLGADAGLPVGLRFLQAAARIIRRRLETASGDSEALPAFFFFSPNAPDHAHWTPMLDNGITDLEGRFWFIGPQSGSGHFVPIDEWTDDGSVFRHAIETFAIGDTAAVLFETRTHPARARYFPKGVAHPNEYTEFPLTGAQITIDDAIAEVNRLHEQSMVTPQPGSISLWQNASKHYPMEDAEARIQGILRAGLICAFPTCTVRAEQMQMTGRLDLELEEPSFIHESGYVRHFLLELKVLRSHHSSGTLVTNTENANAIEEGVKQAASYADERKVNARGLLCFDMRVAFSGESSFAPVTSKAKRLKVRLCIWHLFASPKAYRDWQHSRAAAA